MTIVPMKTLTFVPLCACILLLLGDILSSDGYNMEDHLQRLLEARLFEGYVGRGEIARGHYGVRHRRRLADLKKRGLPHNKSFDFGEEDPGSRATFSTETSTLPPTTTSPATTTTSQITTEKPTPDESSTCASSAAKAWSIIDWFPHLLSLVRSLF